MCAKTEVNIADGNGSLGIGSNVPVILSPTPKTHVGVGLRANTETIHFNHTLIGRHLL